MAPPPMKPMPVIRLRDAARREILFDLDRARRGLFERHGKTEEVDLLHKTSANLLRMWAED
jgi:PKHD-type hydroxylase